MLHRVLRTAFGVATLFISVLTFAHATQAAYTGVILPSKIVIPTANVSARIIDVGVTKAGNLDVPHNYVQAGWYRYGAIPGQIGNAVIDGHVDNGALVPGPFKDLKNAKVGDDITVEMTDGTKHTFSIVDSSVYSTKSFPGRSVFIGDGTGSVLKIITCHGRFIKKEGTYDHRLIVTAVLKNDSLATR